MKDEKWQDFLKWLYKAHSITKDWSPSKTSIELWCEFRSSKRIRKAVNKEGQC